MRTRVGYAGGTQADPEYEDLGDHTETFQVEYDPGHVSYEELLRVYQEVHDPGTQSQYTQYKNILFYHNEEQKQAAEVWKQRWEADNGEAMLTEFRPYSSFTRAEQYHQKYSLRQISAIMDELRMIFPDELSIMESKTAAALNGWLAGYGDMQEIETMLPRTGLSPAEQAHVLEILDRRRNG